MPYKVLIVEDQQMPRQLFEIYISQNKNYIHQASLKDASLALAYCQSKDVDLILMDVYTFQGNSGLVAAEEIKKQFPNIKIIIVTSLPEYSWIKKAKEIGADYFCTTLTVSPHKNSQLLNELGLKAQEKYGVKFLLSDFKKKEGYKRSTVLSNELGLYRQNYCGCKYSIWFEEDT